MNNKQAKKLRRAARQITDNDKNAPAVSYKFQDNGMCTVFNIKTGVHDRVKKRPTARLALSTRGIMQEMKKGFKKGVV